MSAVNALTGPSIAGMDANIGADNALFGTFLLAGEASPSTFTFSTAGPGFSYGPTLGNLLLDIQMASTVDGTSAHDARNGTAIPRCSPACTIVALGSSAMVS